MIEEIEGVEGIEAIDATIFQAASLRQAADDILVQGMVEGDKTALKVLYLRHRTRIYRFVARLTGSDATADEVVNEVFLEVWRHADQFEGKSRLSTWLLEHRPLQGHLGVPTACRSAARRARLCTDRGSRRQPCDLCRKTAEKRHPSEMHLDADAEPPDRDQPNLLPRKEDRGGGSKRRSSRGDHQDPLALCKNPVAKRLAEAGVDRAWVQM